MTEPKTGQTQLTLTDLLICLIEECAEVQKAATKCLRFGWDRNHPGYGHNATVLRDEIEELKAITHELFPHHTASTTKIDRIRMNKERFGVPT